MVKIIIELRDRDVGNNILDNTKTIKDITTYVMKYWNCESVELTK